MAAVIFDMIQPVDSTRLADALDREDGLIKRHLDGKSRLRVKGFMATTPVLTDTELVHPLFRTISELFQRAKNEVKRPEQWTVLSMGITRDFEVAVEEGATLVRIGTDIFSTPGHSKLVPLKTLIPIAYTLSLGANVLMGSLFSGPIRLAMGITNVLMFKNSRAVLGRPFSKAAAEAIVGIFEKRELQQNGILYNDDETRPAQGAFALLNEDAVGRMFAVLKDLGLIKFEDSTPVDFFIKPTVYISQDHIAPTPIESETVFQMPKTSQQKVELLFRVIVMDPMFVDDQGKNLNLTKIPGKYIEAVLNSLNPAAYYRALGRQQLDLLFARSGKFEQTFKANFASAVKIWQGRAAPQDLETLQAFLEQGLLHEFTHALALNLPDVISSDLPAAEQTRRNQFSVVVYINLLSAATALHTSVVYSKNLMKALHAVEGQDAGPATQNQVVRMLALEMFCDRFSMYMFEIYGKLRAYQKAIPDLGVISVDFMRKMEKQGRSNPAVFQLLNELTEAEMKTLAADLEAAGKAHVYISKFGDPEIFDAERAIFDPFLDLLRHFDREKAVNLFSEQHSGGDFFKASQNGTFIADNKLGVGKVA